MTRHRHSDRTATHFHKEQIIEPLYACICVLLVRSVLMKLSVPPSLNVCISFRMLVWLFFETVKRRVRGENSKWQGFGRRQSWLVGR